MEYYSNQNVNAFNHIGIAKIAIADDPYLFNRKNEK